MLRVYANEVVAHAAKDLTALKTFANIGLSLLLLATLLWGGCLSCPQYFMFPASHGGCCNPAGHCKNAPAPAPASRDCNMQAVALPAVSLDAAAHGLLPLSLAPVVASAVPAPVLAAPPSAFGPPHASPPDLSRLHSVLRI